MESHSKKPKRTLAGSPKPTAQRYVRRCLTRQALRIARTIARCRIAISERNRRRALEGAIQTVATQLKKAKRNGFDASATVFNLVLFFLLAERDIQVAKLNALTHPDKWVRSLNARMILLTIHELDLDKVSGQELQQALASSGATPTETTKINLALRKARRAQNSAAKMFKENRNAVIAHRTADALDQLQRMQDLSEMRVLQIAADFYEAANDLIITLPTTIMQVAGIKGLVAQIGARKKL